MRQAPNQGIVQEKIRIQDESAISSIPGGPTAQSTSDQNSLDSIPEVRDGLELLNAGDREGAAVKFAQAYEKRPDLVPAGVAVAIALFNEKKFDQVRFWLEKTVDDCPEDPEAYIVLAEVAQVEGRFLEARMLSMQGLSYASKYTKNAERQKKLAQRGQLVLIAVAERKEKWEDAKTRLDRLVAAAPNEADFETRLGVVLFQMGNMNGALECFNRAIQKGAQLPLPEALLAQLLDQKGKKEEAYKLIIDAARSNPNDFQVMSIAAHLALKWESVSGAKQFADRALKIKPDSTEAKGMCGLIALYEKNFNEAQKYYEEILREKPDDFNGRNGLALALCEQPDPQKLNHALSNAKLNVQANPQSLDALTTFAWVLHKSGQVDDAENILAQVYNTGVISATGAYYLAEIREMRGNKEQAKTLAEAALSTNNNYPKKIAAKELLQRVR